MRFLFYTLVTLGCAVAGYDLWKPWGGLIGAGIGLAAGITNYILYRRRKAKDTSC